jgi:hypothetical protein
LLKLLGQPLINDRITLPALTSSQNLTLAAGETGSTRINPLAVGNAVSAWSMNCCACCRACSAHPSRA